jgi:hypothetical protein
MDYVVFSQEVQRNQNLDRESLNQTKTEALEVVHFDKIVKVDAQKFKCNHEVLSKHELVQLLNYIFLVLRVLFVK